MTLARRVGAVRRHSAELATPVAGKDVTMRGRNIPTNLVTAGPKAAALSAVRLAADLRSGWSPPPVQVPFALQPDEMCVGLVNAGVEQRLDADGGRARRRARSARDATERWRYVDTFWIYVTTARIALKGDRSEWYDFWYINVRALGYDQEGIIVQTCGDPASRLRMEPPDYWFVMVRKLAFNDIPAV